VFFLLSGLSLVSIAYFGTYWFLYEDWRDSPIIFSGLTLILIARLSIHQFQWLSLYSMRRPAPTTPKSGWKVGVATTFVGEAEPTEMLEQTIRALVSMDYPHDTWVLDEGDNDEVKSICNRLGAFHFSRRNMPQYQTESGRFQSKSKHGNYNAWLDAIGFQNYDIISGFDPDHVPRSDFLLNVIGYFEHYRIGYVQTAQAYYNQEASFIARGAAEETYAYYSCSQMTNYAMGYPIVTGCHNTHRVEALKEVGGFATHDADDLLITLLYRTRGWQGVYVPKILARGLTPVDWQGYLAQQRRWARSVLDVKIRVYPKLARQLSLKERVVSFLHGFYYLRGLSTGIAIFLLCVMLSTRGEPTIIRELSLAKAGWLFAVLQLCAFYRQRFFLDWRRECGFSWRAGLLEYAKWPYFLLAALEVVMNRRTSYVLTPKVSRNSGQKMVLWPHFFVAALVGACWVVGTGQGNLPAVLHLWAGAIVLISLGLLWTERLGFPPPYEKRFSAWWCRESGHAFVGGPATHTAAGAEAPLSRGSTGHTGISDPGD
jgi:cellulose synthase (UDP-forming)